jgi:hypothetical protein
LATVFVEQSSTKECTRQPRNLETNANMFFKRACAYHSMYKACTCDVTFLTILECEPAILHFYNFIVHTSNFTF